MNSTGKSFTVRSTLQLKVDRWDDGVAYTCSVEHESLSNRYQTTEVLEVHCECSPFCVEYAKLNFGVRLATRRRKKKKGGSIAHLCPEV